MYSYYILAQHQFSSIVMNDESEEIAMIEDSNKPTTNNFEF